MSPPRLWDVRGFYGEQARGTEAAAAQTFVKVCEYLKKEEQQRHQNVMQTNISAILLKLHSFNSTKKR